MLQAQSTVKDVDGNVYKIITIGKQTWMAENLKTSKYNDGTAIPYMADSTNSLEPTPAYYLYNNDIVNKSVYGVLYNWYVVSTKKLCPTGWHVPTNEEWTTLTTVLGGENAAGGKLKETGTKHWNSPNTGATNEIGFTALPGGYCSVFRAFEGIGSYGAWWSAMKYGDAGAYIRNVSYDNSKLQWNVPSKSCDYSVRCLKD
ncbi:MAG: fibrobacter succinogenes major paralogous domain-containing protein [Bacteroidales bacterium]